jgi:mRNA-degrading endonuclease toxin of MazEF toxin-antitoxin module
LGNPYLDGSDHGKQRRTVTAHVSQVLTVDRGRLTQKVGRLPARVVAHVDDGLRLALDL